MFERAVIVAGIATLLVASLGLAADPPVPPSRDGAAAAGARMEEDAMPKASPDDRKAPSTRASASASASASATARAGSGGTDCAADAAASVERDGKRISAQRSRRTEASDGGCSAEARASTGDAPGE